MPGRAARQIVQRSLRRHGPDTGFMQESRHATPHAPHRRRALHPGTTMSFDLACQHLFVSDLNAHATKKPRHARRLFRSGAAMPRGALTCRCRRSATAPG
jgi:hypothetical protein